MRMIIVNKKGIQIGDNTHNHGHAITLVSLRPTKRIVSNPGKPMPPEDDSEEDAIVLERRNSRCFRSSIYEACFRRNHFVIA
jgi:hypothetical protein